MSLFDKLFGPGMDKKVDKAAKSIIKDFDDVFGDLAKAVEGKNDNKPAEPAHEAPAAPAAPSAQERYDAPSGDSWGEFMPDEENQFNYGGSFESYFEHIFKEDFPGYSFEKVYVGYGRTRVVYRFTKGAGTALTLELMSEKCSARMTRRECEAAGTPYLRFYYDHDGWWNTRSYVVKRMKKYL